MAAYRTDAGRAAWVMRCWGAGTCDGLLSLDHDTERWAVVARDRHLAEAHNTTTPQADQPQADDPLLLDRAAATALRDCLNQLLGDEQPDDGALDAAVEPGGNAAP